MNREQIKGIAERIATVAVSWAIGRGYVPADVGGDLIMVIVGAVVVGWGFWVNTQGQLANATKKVSK